MDTVEEKMSELEEIAKETRLNRTEKNKDEKNFGLVGQDQVV